jgi:hypothetical protein
MNLHFGLFEQSVEVTRAPLRAALEFVPDGANLETFELG